MVGDMLIIADTNQNLRVYGYAADEIRAKAKREERERCLAAVATVRSYYATDIFPIESVSRDAISAAWARKVCDNIRDAICAIDFENERDT
jgi:hypothetical protein